MSLRPVQAIVTKYLPPTNVKGSRIKATAAAGSLTVHIDHALNIEDNHAVAAKALANKLEWRGTWFMGGLPNDSGYCFVCADIIGTYPEAAFNTTGRRVA
jgi:hypothetical protein